MKYITKKEKRVSHLKWFLALIPLGLFAMITAPFIYPLALLFKPLGKVFNPFYLWLDDEIDSAETNKDWLVYCNGKTNNFKYLYTWHGFRNTLWNAKAKIKPKNGRLNCISNEEVIEQIIADSLYRDGKHVDTKNDCLEMAHYKWIDKFGNEGWQVNRGVKISHKYSSVGKSALWYSVRGSVYYRYSVAKEITIFGIPYYFSFKMGANEKRYLLTLKLQKNEKKD